MVKITGTNTYIDVEIDGRVARIMGELGVGKFNCLASSMQEWLVPAGQKINEEDKKMIIQRVTEKTAGSHMVISFDVEEPAKTQPKKEGISLVPKETSEKYLSYMDPIVNELVDLLKKLNEMIETHGDIYDEFLEQYKKMIIPYCTESFLNKWYRCSVRNPGDYYYLNKTATVYFTMKSESKALVFMEPAPGLFSACHKFELKKENGKYLIDKMFYYYAREHVYHRMDWL